MAVDDDENVHGVAFYPTKGGLEVSFIWSLIKWIVRVFFLFVSHLIVSGIIKKPKIIMTEIYED